MNQITQTDKGGRSFSLTLLNAINQCFKFLHSPNYNQKSETDFENNIKTTILMDYSKILMLWILISIS